MGLGIYGWGYEGQTVSDLIDFCRRVRAVTVVDVRLNAISRKKGFSKTALSQALFAEGFDYLHLRSLGNPKGNRPGFAHPGTAEALAAHSRFSTEVLDSEQAQSQLKSIVKLLDEGPVVLLCFEQAPKCCHRHLIIDRVRAIVASQNKTAELATA